MLFYLLMDFGQFYTGHASGLSHAGLLFPGQSDGVCRFGVESVFVRHPSAAFEYLLLTELVFIHVTIAMMSYAAFSLACISGGLYLVSNHLLKEKKWNRLLRILPSLDRLESFSVWSVVAGAVFLLISVLLGIIYGYQTVGNRLWLDPKLWGTFWVMILYGWIIWQWTRTRLTGRRLAWWSSLSFLSILLNYFITRTGVSFHQWF